MHDLRHDQEAADERTHYNLRAVKVLTVEQLHTVPMPNLRSPDARTLDAQARDLRTADDKLRAEFVRLVDALQALRLQFDVLIEEQARTITALEAYIHDHSEAEE